MTVTPHQLLFFDTFSHENAEVTQLDLVQFPRPVQVSEIRVIPLGARVEADFPGGFRLGATNPSAFEIEFFINDLSKRGAATFEKIGKLLYSQHRCIQLEFDKKPPTDGLLLRGNYNTITLAVYGSPTKVQREPSPPKVQTRPNSVPQPPPEKVNTHERIKNWLADTKVSRKQHDYEVNPSEDDPEWEPKPPRSPAEFETGKTWTENPETNRESSKERIKDKRSFDRSQSREKSWEKSERSSSKKESKREANMNKDTEKERERLVEIERVLLREKEGESETEKIHHRGSRERYEEDLVPPYEVHVARRGHSDDNWEDRMSVRSEEVPVRRPRTPTEPPAEPPEPPLESHPPHSNSAFSEDGEDATKGSVLPPPIIAGEMEAISDDEELLDLPLPEVGEDNFDHETIEEEEAMVVEPPLIEEVNEEAEGFEYEEIMSDEDDLPEYQYEDFVVEEWEDWIKPFTPQDLLELPKLLFFNNPSITEYEKEVHHWNAFGHKWDGSDENINSAKTLTTLIDTPLPQAPVYKPLDGDLSQDAPEEIEENWVQVAEQVCQLLPSALVYLENCDEILQKLLLWVDCGLDFDLALNQQQPVFKIRHMKVGIRLTTLLLQCSSNISSLLLSRGIVDKLFYLNEQSHLALSIRLMILRCIDAITDTPSGLRYFIDNKTVNGKTTYEKILELMPTLQQSRAKVALSATIRKIHFLEVCEKLHADTFALLEFMFEEEDEQVERKVQLNSDHLNTREENMEMEIPDDLALKEESNLDDPRSITSPLWQCNVPPSLLNSIVSCFKEIFRMYTFADQLLVQPNRWLPGSKQFQLPKSQQNPFSYIYSVFDAVGLLESLSGLLVTPALCQHPSLINLIKTFLKTMVSNEHGLIYLATERKLTALIIKGLLQFGDDCRDGSQDGFTLCQLGIHLSFSMHIIHQLDCIAQLKGSSKRKKVEGGFTNPDYSHAVVHFNSLESLLASSGGKESIVSVLGLPNFTEILFPYLTMETGEDHESTPTKAACFGYAVDLLSIVIKFQDSTQLLEKHAEQIFSFIPSEEKEVQKLEDFNKLVELKPWLKLARSTEIFSYDKLSNLCSIVQENLEKIDKIPGELIVALRILCYLTIPKAPVSEINSEEHNNELIEELKYKYATIQLFSADLPSHLINILSKLFGIYQQPFLHSSNFVGSEGGLVVMLIKPTLALLKYILSQIIQARNTEFKDLTTVGPLVQTYILLQAFPTSSTYFTLAHELQQEVISILLGYTQVVYTTEGEEVLSKSLWTQMMAEIFKHVMTAPHTMVCVITLVTELLPLPLPIQTHFPLSEEENSEAVKVRKLWSAHLYSLAPTIHELIHRLGLATHPLLTHSLRRMCVALSDLSAPMALLVAKATLDLVLQTHRLDQRTQAKEDSKGNGVTIKEETKCTIMTAASQQTARALNMLASLVSHAPTKIAVIHLLKGGSPTLTLQTPPKMEEKYSSLLPTWCKILTLPMKVSSHIASQECLVTVYQYLLDHENTMQVNHSESQDFIGNSSQLFYSGVPHKDILVPMIESLIDVVRNSSSTPVIIQHSLKVLLRLIEHNYGFYYVKSVLDVKKGSLFSVFRQLSHNFCKSRQEFVTLLQDLLSFCHLLISPYEERTNAISTYELASHISWKSDAPESLGKASSATTAAQEKNESDVKIKEEDDKTDSDKTMEEGEIIVKEEVKNEDETSLENVHPLKVLEHLVVTEVGEEEMMESLYEEISHLISLMEKEASGAAEISDFEEPSPVGLESLQVLFGNRIVWTFPTMDDDLHSLWLSLPPFEEVEERDVVSVNLLETCRKYATNFDLVATLHKLVKGQASHSISPQKLAKAVPKYKPSSAAIRPNQRGAPYVAPMRGRSFGRPMNIRSDPFRSRPPNTSRPPSLHVDDFVALESTGHQPTGPTGYNKISFGRGKMMLDSMRGSRGRVRGEGRGGRFFHRPPFRGDGSRGMGRGIGMRRGPGWVFRGDGSPRGSFRGGPMNQMQPRFRGRPFSRGIPGLKDRFPQKFMERGRRGDGGRHMRGFR